MQYKGGDVMQRKVVWAFAVTSGFIFLIEGSWAKKNDAGVNTPAIASRQDVTAASLSPVLAPSNGFITATGQITAGGLQGEWLALGDLATGRFAFHADLGAYRTADIYDGHTRWRVDPSGGSHPLNSESALQAAITEAWLARFIWTGQHLPSESQPQLEIVENRHYRIVTVTPNGGQPVRLWFDEKSGSLVKATRWLWFFEYSTTYDDYRDEHGLHLPFVIVNTAAGMVERIKVAKYSFSEKVPSDSFAQPAQPEDSLVPASGTTVPVDVFPQLTLRASVNGRPMDFLFDTGGHSVLTPGAAKLLGLTATGSQQSGGSGAGTLLQQDTHIDELRIGEAVLRDQHFFVLSLPYSDVEQGAKPPLAGLLGLEIAERFIVRLDYRAGTLSLLPRTSTQACRSGWRPIRFTYDMPSVDAQLDGNSASFTVDTGNNGGLLLYSYWLKKQGLDYDRGVQSLSYGAGGASNNWVSYGKSFNIGTPVIAKPMIRTTDDKGGVALSESEAGNLGTNLLGNYTITLDYGRSRGCFDYVPGYHPLPFNRAGLRAIKDNHESFLVTLVNSDGPADKAGLRKNDRITTVDGVPASQLGAGDLTLALTRPPGSRISLQYERGGEARQTVVTTQEVLQ